MSLKIIYRLLGRNRASHASLLLWALLLVSMSVSAQTITVNAPSQVAEGENFRLSYTINTQDVEEFRAGNIPSGLDVIAGPYRSERSSYSMVNGYTSSSSSITFTYILYASKKGSYSISAAHASVNGKNIGSKPIKIIVRGGNGRNGGNGAPRMHEEDEEGGDMSAYDSNGSAKDLFIRVSASKQKVYEQEPLLLTYKVYSRARLSQIEAKMPELTGIHTQEIKLPNEFPSRIERVNGKNYRCTTFGQYLIFPQVTGTVEIPTFTCKAIVTQRNRNVDPVEAFLNGGSGYIEIEKKLSAPAIKLTVSSLPKRPANFSGGVGKFSVSATANHQSVAAGTPLSIRVVVSGRGNLKLIKQPTLSLPKNFDVTDPKITDHTKVTAAGTEGSMVYDFLVIPQNMGQYTIPAVEFVYFDLDSQKYVNAKSSPINLKVTKGNGKNSEIYVFDSKENDIRPIHSEADGNVMSASTYFGSPIYYMSLGLVCIMALLVFLVLRKRMEMQSDFLSTRQRKANGIAVKRLQKAYRLMSQGDNIHFYDEVLRALWGYVGDKLRMPVEELSRDNISEKLRTIGIELNTIEMFLNSLDTCEYERYAPGDPEGNMNKTYQSAMEAIQNIEEKMKNPGLIGKLFSHRYCLMVCLILWMTPMGIMGWTKETADMTYKKGDYQEAIHAYRELIKRTPNATLYYNLGNAYYRMNNLPQAILAYERALKLDPSDDDILFNLNFVKSKTIDKIVPIDRFFLVDWYWNLVTSMSIDAWGTLSVVLLVVFFGALMTRLFNGSERIRSLSHTVCYTCLVGCVMSVVAAYSYRAKMSDENGAIVITPSIRLLKTPTNDAAQTGVVHEGTKVFITDRDLKGWLGVRLEDGREGWISEQQVELI